MPIPHPVFTCASYGRAATVSTTGLSKVSHAFLDTIEAVDVQN